MGIVWEGFSRIISYANGQDDMEKPGLGGCECVEVIATFGLNAHIVEPESRPFSPLTHTLNPVLCTVSIDGTVEGKIDHIREEHCAE